MQVCKTSFRDRFTKINISEKIHIFNLYLFIGTCAQSCKYIGKTTSNVKLIGDKFCKIFISKKLKRNIFLKLFKNLFFGIIEI